MNLSLANPQQEIEKIKDFVRKVLHETGKKKVVIAVSGGVDSVLALGLLGKSLSKSDIFPVFLPFENQNMDDAKLAAEFLKIPKNNLQEINIGPMVEATSRAIKLDAQFQPEQINQLSLGQANQPQPGQANRIRLGNIMARSRMIIIYDLAKKLDAIVCGTENKSETRLGYFTRFGDEASDFEPIAHLYKTQVRQLADFLKLPKIFLKKQPSAGLWKGQTDEGELGFTYVQADQIMFSFFEDKLPRKKIAAKFNFPQDLVEKVLHRVEKMSFKGKVPYQI